MYAKHTNVVIAKVDATANDVPDEIQGFPTIKLFPAGKKSDPVSYQGSRTIEDLAQFIRDNGSHKVDVLTGKEELKRDDDESIVSAAPAATASEKAGEAKEGVKEKIKEAAEKVKEALVDEDGDSSDVHDEL